MVERFSMKDMVRLGLVQGKDGVWAKPGKDQPVSTKKHKYNAQKITEGGVQYDSKRELKFKHLLDLNKIPYQMKAKYILQEKFKYRGEAVRQIAMIPDFVIMKGDQAVALTDVKGMITPVYKLKEKLLKKTLASNPIPIFTPRNNKEMAETITELLKLIA